MAAKIKRNSPAGRALQWAAAFRAAQKHQPVAVSDKYVWLRLIAKSELTSTTRLVAHTLCLHGQKDGCNVYPSTLTLAAETGLTERSVCTHIDILVRAGRLYREQRKTKGRDWAMTLYTLCAPKAVLDAPENEKLIVPDWEVDPTWKPERGTERGSVPTTSSEARGTEPDARGAERHARGTERGSAEALNDVQPSLSILVSQEVSQQSVLQAALRRSPDGEKREPEGSTTNPQRQTSPTSQKVLQGAGRDLKPPPRIKPYGEPLDDAKLKRYVGELHNAGKPANEIVAVLCQRAHHDRIRRCLANDFGVPWISSP